MDKERFEKRKRAKELRRMDLDVGDEEIKIHNADESPTHLTLKAMCALKIQQKGRGWSTEVEFPDGHVADVVDWGPPDGKAVVYEIETACTPQTAKENAQKYVGGMVRDCLTIPAQEAPEEPAAMTKWLDRYIVG